MKYWLILLIVVCALIATIMGVQAQGTLATIEQEPPMLAILREFRFTDDQWCWRGLCLGQTPFDEAASHLRDQIAFADLSKVKDQGTSSVIWEWRDHPKLSGLLARPRDAGRLARVNIAVHDDSLLLADVLHLFGTPQTLYIQVTGGDLVIQICFEHDACAWVAQRSGMLTPATTVIGVDFMTAEAFQAQRVYGVEPITWRGFTNYTPGRWYHFAK